MAGAIKLLKIQLLAYWRKSFSKRGIYDKVSFVLMLIILLAGYRFAVLLNQTAKSLSEGKTNDLNPVLAIAFLIWILPASESQRATGNLPNFAFLPLSKNQFSLIGLANVFLVPTSIAALIVSLSIIYPLAFSENFTFGLVSLLFYTLFAAFSLTLFVRLLKRRIFRFLLFLAVILLTIFRREISFGFAQNIFISNVFWLAFSAFIAFIFAFLELRQTASASTQTSHRITPQFIARINLPMKFGEMIKKDFLASWKILDCYIALLISIIYIIILLSGELSFFSFSVAISFSIMMCGSLAFNIFGMENTASLQRLSLLPIEPEDLLLTKNKAFGLLIFSQTFFLLPLIFYKFGLFFLLTAILKISSVTFFYMAWGNSLSIRFPFKMNSFEVSFGGSLQEMISAVFLITLINILPDFFLMPNELAILLINIGLVFLSYFVYYFSLKRVSAKLPNEWEDMASKIST